MATKAFMVMAVSSNTNSFGLKQMTLVAEDGTAYTACANSLNVRQMFEVVHPVLGKSGVPDFTALNWELPTEIMEAPLDVVEVLWGRPRKPTEAEESEIAKIDRIRRNYLEMVTLKVHEMTPVRLVFRPEGKIIELVGAKLSLWKETLPREKAVEFKLRKPGEEYIHTQYVVPSALPVEFGAADRQGCRKNVFRIGPKDEGDWFVAASYVGPVVPEYHPEGSWFSLYRWDHELPYMGGRIDGAIAGEPRVRVPVSVREFKFL